MRPGYIRYRFRTGRTPFAPTNHPKRRKNMKKTAVIIAAAFALSAPLAAFAMDHESMPMDHGSMKGMEHMEHMEHKGGVAHEEVVGGVKASFKIISMTERMKEMKMEVPAGMKETHHLMVEFTD